MATIRLAAGDPDPLGVLDRLLRLDLAARRLGFAVVVTELRRDVADLACLAGVAGLLALDAGGQAEVGEQAGIEEVDDPGDRPA